MQPPPFEPQFNAPRQKKSNTLVIAIVAGVFVCCLLPIGLLAGGGYAAFKQSTPLITCSVAATEIGEALEAYSKANGGKLPKATEWQTAIRPYYVKASAKNDGDRGPFAALKPDEPWGCGEGSSKTALAFNSTYSGKKVSEIKEPSQALLVFETSGPAVNKSAVYKPGDTSTAPKIFGTPRPLVAITAEFQPTMSQNGRLQPVMKARVRTGTNGTSVESSSNN